MDGYRQTGDDEEEAKMLWRLGDQEHIFYGRFSKGQCRSGMLDGNKVDQAM